MPVLKFSAPAAVTKDTSESRAAMATAAIVSGRDAVSAERVMMVLPTVERDLAERSTFEPSRVPGLARIATQIPQPRRRPETSGNRQPPALDHRKAGSSQACHA